MGIDDASYFLECLVRICNIAYPNATSRYISKPESSKHIRAGRGAGRQSRKIDAAKPIYSLKDVFAQCDFFHVPELDDLLVDCKKSLFKFEPVGEKSVLGPGIVKLLTDIRHQRDAKKRKCSKKCKWFPCSFRKDASRFEQSAQQSAKEASNPEGKEQLQRQLIQ